MARFFQRIARCLFAVGGLGILCAAGLPAAAHAQPAPTSSSRTHAASSGHVTILVLDMSGSMATNDPNGIRCSAASAYISLSGPGNFIGVVGLDNNNGSQGGSYNFQLAQVWSQPVEMSTLSARNGLIQTIAEKSNHCAPDGNTPTYDALNQALTMLKAATHNGQLSGSAILLTDGQPDPDTQPQINAIQADLASQFQKNNWPVDVIALGADKSFHPFLQDLANATSGNFYDDGNGVVPGVSPLNITPFFVKIFSERIGGRTLGPTIPVTKLDGGTTSRDFQLGPGNNDLYVIVIKDHSSTTVTTTSPDGQTLPPQVPGTQVLTGDPYYAMFIVNGPQDGTWQVNVTGSGEFLMDSLIVSGLTVAITAPASNNTALPLGQSFTVSATVVGPDGLPVTGNQVSVSAHLTAPAGSPAQCSEQLILSDTGSPGLYQAMTTIPVNCTAGTYDILVQVSEVTDTPISSSDRTVRLELFPVPYFFKPGSSTITDSVIEAPVVVWDAALQFIYSHLPWLAGWPLGGLPAQTEASLAGQVEKPVQTTPGQPATLVPYTDATVTGTATLVGSKTSVPLTVVNDGNGRFHALFSAPVSGTYQVTFMTSGSFEDTHGDFGTTVRTVRLVVQHATLFWQEITAWLITLIYLLILVCVGLLINFLWRPVPRQVNYENSFGIRRPFSKQGRGLGILIHRNLLPRPIGGERGLELRFTRRGRKLGRYEVRLTDPQNMRWSSISGTALSARRFKSVNGLVKTKDDGSTETYRFLKSGESARSAGGPYGSFGSTPYLPNRPAEQSKRRSRGPLAGLTSWLAGSGRQSKSSRQRRGAEQLRSRRR
jgi:hypothetical protein